MGCYASEVVKLANSWLGKKESDGSFKTIIDTYNAYKPLPRGYKVKYTDEWCATFVSALFIKLGYTNILPFECSCQKMIELCKAKGIYIENENRLPNVGDVIFYDWQDNGVGDNLGWSDHVGVVVNVSRETFTIIEGNKNAVVGKRELKKNTRYIRGFAVPKYDSEVVNTSKPSETSVAITMLAKEVILGLWGNGSERYERIKEATQAKVNELLKG